MTEMHETFLTTAEIFGTGVLSGLVIFTSGYVMGRVSSKYKCGQPPRS